MGAAGTDPAIKTADVAIMDDGDNVTDAVFADMGTSLLVVASGLRLWE